MFRNWAIVKWATLGIVVATTLALWWSDNCSRPRVTLTDNLHPEELGQLLEAHGYQWKWVADDVMIAGRLWIQGLYLMRSDDARPWEEIVTHPRGYIQDKTTGVVVVSWRPHARFECETGLDREFHMGRWSFYGDPAELHRLYHLLNYRP